MSDPARARRLAEVALVAMLYAVPLTVSWTVAGAHIAIGIAAFFAILHGALGRSWPVARTPADAGFVAFAGASVLATVFAIESASNPLALKKLLLIPLVHVTAAALARGSRARWALRLFVLALGVTALVTSLRFLLVSHDPSARLRSTTHYMTFSGLLLLALPLAAAGALAARRRLRALYVLGTAVMAVALLLTFTRGAWLGAVVAACAILVRVRPRLLLLVPPAVVAALLLLPSNYRARALSSFDLQYHSNSDRLQLWRAAVQIWRDHPWTGVGLGDLQRVYRQYAPPEVERIHGHMHNNWMHVLATMGTLGILAFAWLMVSMGRLVWRSG
ncbi:MAG: O-antigen ligase family protein, partial [Candidatus Krumholzibacteriia bacterium]